MWPFGGFRPRSGDKWGKDPVTTTYVGTWGVRPRVWYAHAWSLTTQVGSGDGQFQ